MMEHDEKLNGIQYRIDAVSKWDGDQGEGERVWKKKKKKSQFSRQNVSMTLSSL